MTSFNFVKSFLRLFFILLLLTRCSQTPKQLSELSSKETGVNFRNDISESQHNNIMTYEYTYNGGGIAAGDINNDGLTDLYFSGNSVPNKLFLNKGDWKFDDITSSSNTAGRQDWKTGVTMADVNGDGWLDIYVCYSGNAPGEGYNKPVIKDHPKRSNQLFINNKCKRGDTPTFTERAKEFGIDAIGTFSTQAYFFDYDRDGDLDLFLLNHANMFYAAFFNTNRLRNLRHPYFGNALYQNEGNTFTNVSEKSGLHGSGLNFGLSAAISDLNLDGWPDIYVTNDYDEQDFCYINNHDGTFKEVSHTVFDHLSKFGMGSDIADINNDGLQDILVLDMLPEDNHRQKLLRGPDEYDRYTLAVDSGYHHQYMRNTLQLNRGFAEDSLPRFSEIGQLAGISNTDWSWAPLFVDIDNDGMKDIFIANGYLRDYNNLDFIKYTGNVYNEAKSSNKTVDYLSLIQKLPSTRLNNYIFKNTDGIHFTNVTKDWGLTREAVTNGAVYADLDNDGDYDLVTNNLNDEAGIFRNNQEQIQRNHYLKIKLKGEQPNTFGIGSKIWITAGDRKIFQEVYYTRGYESSVEPSLTIGIGQLSQIDQVKVRWPNGTVSTLSGIRADTSIVIEQDKSVSSDISPLNSPNKMLLKDVTAQSGIDFRHIENKFIDFKTQRLLLHQLSRQGGKLAKGDVNKDGNDDVFFCGAIGQAGALFLGRDNGTFSRSDHQPWQNDADFEDIDAVFFDADSDGDEDLYVVSGGNEFKPDAPFYQDRLYENDGNGKFNKNITALPIETTSGSCAVAADYDKDGDPDLFVGGRHMPSSYGLVPRSFILRNDSKPGAIKFTDVTAQLNTDIANPGMVTDALWTDYNNDTWPDLIVVGEWMPIRIFENEKGKLKERNVATLDKSNGWWTSIFSADIDEDGDADYFVGNAGSNLQFKATKEEPVQLFVNDYNNDGVLDPVLCYYIQGKSYPVHSRDELLEQVNTMRKKFTNYSDYADATVADVADESQLSKSYQFKAYKLESSVLENLGSGQFTLQSLPSIAQFSCVNGFLFDDFNNDNLKELLVAGNFYPFRPQLGRSDASKGQLLRFDHGKIKSTDRVLSETWLSGDVRDMTIVTFKTGVKRVVVSRNNDHASVYAFNF